LPDKEKETTIVDTNVVDESREASQKAVFDRAAFKKRMLDDEEIIKKIITGILQTIPGMIDELRIYIADGDIHSAGRQAHTIKGAAANLGCELLRKAALEIEMASKSESIPKITGLLPALENEWAKLEPVLKDACA
jgi:HPt (histidine-containing phosphotransfer) domain-containing protein